VAVWYTVFSVTANITETTQRTPHAYKLRINPNNKEFILIYICTLICYTIYEQILCTQNQTVDTAA